MRSSRPGFTLIELLLVIGIIAILASIVIVAINPAKSVSDVRDANRRDDITRILNAVYDYIIDNNGDLPAGIPVATPKVICQGDMSAVDCAKIDGVSLQPLLGTYLTSIPKDPLVTETGTGTNYMIMQNEKHAVTVTAPGAERAESISVTR